MTELTDSTSGVRLSPQDDTEHWTNWLGRLLWDVSTRTSALGETALAGTPLSLSALGVLDWIADHPGITIAQITRRSPTTQQAISQVAARLQKLGLIERRLSGGRGVGLYITATGRRVHAQGNQMRRQFEQGLREALGDDRYDGLRRLLEATRAAVIELEGQAGADIPRRDPDE
jgi:DNA-binding MarR family transcriptional regulator